MSSSDLSVLLLTCGSWYLPQTAKAFQERGNLAGLWITLGNHTGISPTKYRRGWPFHAAMLPFYFWAPQIVTERASYSLFPLWKAWLVQQQFPKCNVVQAIMGYGTEPFNRAEQMKALKVVDCPNSHPTTLYWFWQRELDQWCPGEKVPIPQWMFARMKAEVERADVVLCPSSFVRDTMQENGISKDKCFINPFGVNTSVFQPRYDPPSRIRFISVGTICLRKGHHYLFRAFEMLKKQIPEAELICVGDYKSDFRKERPKWDGSFRHYPHLTHPELAQILKTATAFVIASVEEGFARVLSEAMAAGLPIIGTYESGAGTLVTDGVEGFIVSSRQPELLAQAMLRVSDVELNRRMGEAAYLKGALRNTWQDYGDRLLAHYTERLSKMNP
jgi:glycosyltransferase involved in cell wall biosynthesis